jgi:hypothetical protein
MRLARLLRLTAIGLAILAFLDPPVQVAFLTPLKVGVAVAESPLDTMPASDAATSTRAEAANAAANAIVSGLGTGGEVSVRHFDDPMRLPCDAQSPCVIVTDGAMPVHPPADRVGHTSLVRIGEGLSPNVRIVTVAGTAAHRTAEGTLSVTVEGRGVTGRTTRVQVRDGAAVAGEAAHTWTADGRVDLTVPWWPLAPGQRRLSVTALTDEIGERSSQDNSVNVVMDVGDARWPVLVYERRPSWSSTFVRRALERDPRFEVEAYTAIAPAVSAGTGVARLDDLDRARVVIVGGVDALTAGDVSALEDYLLRRGGTVVLVPDRAPTGPVQRLLAHRWREHLTPATERVGPFTGSEWLVPEGVDELDEVTLDSERGAVVVSSPSGEGRIVVAGAMDAWRHRGDDGPFDVFWRSLVADLAKVSGDPVEVSLSPRIVRPGDRVAVTVRSRSVRTRTEWRAEATLLCSGQPELPVRLWPGHAPGQFDGVARPRPVASECVVRAAIEGLGEGRAPVLVTQDPIETGQTSDVALRAAVERSGGQDAKGPDIASVVDALKALAPGTRTPESRFPMRSPWWLVPFIGCLAGEWWLRRRAGLR